MKKYEIRELEVIRGGFAKQGHQHAIHSMVIFERKNSNHFRSMLNFLREEYTQIKLAKTYVIEMRSLQQGRNEIENPSAY